MGGLLSDADKSVLAGGFAAYLAESMQAGLEAGIAGWRDDDLAFVTDWGFSLAALASGPVPLSIWQGGQDLMVPGAHGAWLAGQLPGARTHLLPAAGHLTLAAATFGEILDELLDMIRCWPLAAGRWRRAAFAASHTSPRLRRTFVAPSSRQHGSSGKQRAGPLASWRPAASG